MFGVTSSSVKYRPSPPTLNATRPGACPTEPDEDVDIGGEEVALVLELLVLGPIESVLPPIWMSTPTERIATAMTTITKVDRFLAGLVMGYFSPGSSLVSPTAFRSSLMRRRLSRRAHGCTP